MSAVKPFPSPVALRPEIADPPSVLGEPGAALWRGIQAEWDISDSAAMAILTDACVARDTAERLRLQIDLSGDEIETGNGSTKANPLIMVQLTARGLTARLL